MEMYHGTSLKRGNKILNDGIIKKDASKQYGKTCLMPTTDGYVYLTNDLIKALKYGTVADFEDDDIEEYLVFCINIDKSILEADEDEIKYTLIPLGLGKEIKDINNPTLQETLIYAHSAKVGQDIHLKKCRAKYIRFAFSDTNGVVGFLNINSEIAKKAKEDFINNLKWIDL